MPHFKVTVYVDVKVRDEAYDAAGGPADELIKGYITDVIEDFVGQLGDHTVEVLVVEIDDSAAFSG